MRNGTEVNTEGSESTVRGGSLDTQVDQVSFLYFMEGIILLCLVQSSYNTGLWVTKVTKEVV